MTRVLDRRIDRWARGVRAERPQDADTIVEHVVATRTVVRSLVSRLAEAGAIDDAAFAATRVRTLARAGKSKKVVSAHLAAKGVEPGIAEDAIPDDEDYEVGAALALARRRRIGPFRRGPAPAADERQREAGILARAGFPQPVVKRALRMGADDAEAFLVRLRQG